MTGQTGAVTNYFKRLKDGEVVSGALAKNTDRLKESFSNWNNLFSPLIDKLLIYGESQGIVNKEVRKYIDLANNIPEQNTASKKGGSNVGLSDDVDKESTDFNVEEKTSVIENFKGMWSEYYESRIQMATDAYEHMKNLGYDNLLQSKAFQAEIFASWDNMFKSWQNTTTNHIDAAIRNQSKGASVMKKIQTAFSNHLRKEAIRTLVNIAATKAKYWLMELLANKKELSAATGKSAGITYGNVFAQVSATPAWMTAPAVAAQQTSIMVSGASSFEAGSNVAHGGVDYITSWAADRTWMLKEGEAVLQPEANKDLRQAANTINNAGVGSSGEQAPMYANITVELDGDVFAQKVVEIVAEGNPRRQPFDRSEGYSGLNLL